MSWFYTYRTSRPKAGGVKAQTRKGKFGQTWLGKEWVANIENGSDEQRLSRGRSYARHGNVKSIAIKPGLIKARVNGSYGTYTVKIETPVLPETVWDKVMESLSRSMAVTSQLISGQAPDEISAIFEAAGAKLSYEFSIQHFLLLS